MTEKGGNDGNVWEWRGRIVGMFFFGVLAFVGGVLGLQGLAVLPSGFVVLGLPVLAVVWFLLRLFDGREINTNNSGQGINTSNSGREIDTNDSGRGYVKAEWSKAWWLKAGRRVLVLLFCGLVGFCWASFRAELRVDVALPPSLEWRDIVVEGTVRDFAKHDERASRFLFDIERVLLPKPQALNLRARLAFYHHRGGKTSSSVFIDGAKLRLKVRIRPPRESANPHSFDYAGWLFANNIRAAGYVRDNDGIVVLESGGGLRHSLSQRAQNLFADNPVGALLAALIVGDRSQMSEQQWRVLRRTGTAHLFAISGAHLTIAAGFVAFLFSFLAAVSDSHAHYAGAKNSVVGFHSRGVGLCITRRNGSAGAAQFFDACRRRSCGFGAANAAFCRLWLIPKQQTLARSSCLARHGAFQTANPCKPRPLSPLKPRNKNQTTAKTGNPKTTNPDGKTANPCNPKTPPTKAKTPKKNIPTILPRHSHTFPSFPPFSVIPAPSRHSRAGGNQLAAGRRMLMAQSAI